MSKEMKIDARMVRKLRELRGWSQEQLAEAAGRAWLVNRLVGPDAPGEQGGA